MNHFNHVCYRNLIKGTLKVIITFSALFSVILTLSLQEPSDSIVISPLIFLGLTTVHFFLAIPQTLPLALGLTVDHIFYQWHINREKPIWLNAGMSPFRMAKPFILCSLIIVGISAGLQHTLLPKAYNFKEQLLINIKEQSLNILFNTGYFNHFKSTSFFSLSREENRFHNIILEKKNQQKKSSFLFAETLTLIDTNDGIKGVVEDGSYYFAEGQHYFSFEKNIFNIESLIFEKSTFNLSNEAVSLPSRVLFAERFSDPKKLTEFHTRLILPLTAILIMMLALVWAMRNREPRDKKLNVSGPAVVFLAYLLLTIFLKRIEKTPDIIPFLYILLATGCLSIVVILIYRSRTSGMGR